MTVPAFVAAQSVQTMEAVAWSPFTLAMGDYKMMEKLKDPPFFVTVSTPFTRTAAIALEARRTFQTPAFPTLDALNAERLIVTVSPGSSLITVDAIENVVVKHGDTVTKPLRAEVTPTVVQNAMGAKKESARGAFMFDFYVFDPQYGPLTLVLIGKRGNFEWEMTAQDLAQLK